MANKLQAASFAPPLKNSFRKINCSLGNVNTDVSRALLKGLPAVNREKCSHRRRPSTIENGSLHFSTGQR